jgi:hypothetical protein
MSARANGAWRGAGERRSHLFLALRFLANTPALS